MRLSTLIITAFSLYSFMGICPMQMAMMTSSSEGGMAMMSMHEMPSPDMAHIATTNSCGTCMRSVDLFALKEVSYYVSDTVAVLPALRFYDFNTVLYLEEPHPIAHTGPPILASDIVKHIVFRT